MQAEYYRSIPHCPRCRSTSITYIQKPSLKGVIVVDALGGPFGAILGSSVCAKGYAVCLNCGKEWKI